MKLIKFNEMLSSKEELDVMDEIKSRLVYLMDDGLKVDSTKSEYHDTVFLITTGKQKRWVEIKDYIIPLFIFLDKNYKLNYGIKDNEPYHIIIDHKRGYTWGDRKFHKNDLLDDNIHDDTTIPTLQFRILNKK
jgi:hypothetical protein